MLKVVYLILSHNVQITIISLNEITCIFRISQFAAKNCRDPHTSNKRPNYKMLHHVFPFTNTSRNGQMFARDRFNTHPAEYA